MKLEFEFYSIIRIFTKDLQRFLYKWLWELKLFLNKKWYTFLLILFLETLNGFIKLKVKLREILKYHQKVLIISNVILKFGFAYKQNFMIMVLVCASIYMNFIFFLGWFKLTQNLFWRNWWWQLDWMGRVEVRLGCFRFRSVQVWVFLVTCVVQIVWGLG